MTTSRPDAEKPNGSAIKATEGAALPRLVYWKADLCAMLGVKLRTLERMISAGEIPAPDRRLRGRPCWLRATIEAWAAAGCANPATIRP